MGADSAPTVDPKRPGSAGPRAATPRTLAEEHALLRGQVVARAARLLAVVSCGGWPGAELAALAAYARAEVLRQASDEERLLFPARRSEAVTRLARDHARLRAKTELLARAAAGEQLFSPGQLAAAARDLVGQLERHMSAEEQALAAGRAPDTLPATVALGGQPHQWYPLTEGPVMTKRHSGAAADRALRPRPDHYAGWFA